jgi:hypothetical protein
MKKPKRWTFDAWITPENSQSKLLMNSQRLFMHKYFRDYVPVRVVVTEVPKKRKAAKK